MLNTGLEELFKQLVGFLAGAQHGLNSSDLALNEAIRPGEVGGWGYVVNVMALEELCELIRSKQGHCQYKACSAVHTWR